MKELSASDITKEVLLRLSALGYRVWRQNNHATRGRKNHGMIGLPDVIGYTREGVFVGCEVKKIGDTLSQGQIDFLDALQASGGVALCAVQEGYDVKIKKFSEVNKVKVKNDLSV